MEMFKILILSFWIFTHPVHISLMSVDYSGETGNFKVFIKVYFDDFILDYRLLTGYTGEYDFAEQNDIVKEIVCKYVDNKVQIFAGDKKLVGRVLNIESAGGELKLNLEYENKRRSNKYTVRNQIMTELYNDQTNLLLFRYGNFEEGIKLNPEKKEHMFKIK